MWPKHGNENGDRPLTVASLLPNFAINFGRVSLSHFVSREIWVPRRFKHTQKQHKNTVLAKNKMTSKHSSFEVSPSFHRTSAQSFSVGLDKTNKFRQGKNSRAFSLDKPIVDLTVGISPAITIHRCCHSSNTNYTTPRI